MAMVLKLSDNFDEYETVGRGTRIQAIEVSLNEGQSGILRVPLNPGLVEFESVSVLLRHLAEFLPNPQLINVAIGDEIKELVFCDKVPRPLGSKVFTVRSFASHLDELKSIEDKITFLKNLRRFVNQCKALFYAEDCLPDLIGPGNLTFHEERPVLLDLNNTAFDRPKAGQTEIVIPLDEQGLPVFDLSLRLLYQIEKRLLSCRKGVDPRTRLVQLTNSKDCLQRFDLDDLTEALFTDRENLKSDPFYGAIRKVGRRSAAEEIIERNPFL